MATSHALAVALDDYLRLTDPANRHVEAAAVFSTLHRLRSRAEAEVERLLAILDAIDGDADLEPDCDDEPEQGFEPNLATTAAEDGAGRCAESAQPTILGLRWRGDELEAENEHGGDALDSGEVSWPESAGAGSRGMTTWDRNDDDEDSDPHCNLDDDNGIADEGGTEEQGFGDYAHQAHIRQAAWLAARRDAYEM